MDIEFDPAKDAANISKHGVSLARAADLEILADVADPRFEEPRRRAYGLIDGDYYCMAYTIRPPKIRVINLRRAHQEEFDHYVS